MIQHLRHALSWPIIVLQIVMAFLLASLGYAARGLMWLQRGAIPHVYMPIIHVKRFVRGEPLWQVQDCIKLGLQPRTDEDKARADADERLIKLVCTCGEPGCATAGMYISRDSPFV